MAGERANEFGGHGACVRRIAHAHFFRQGVQAEPIEQRPAQTADDAGLREVDVGVDEAGQNHRPAPVADHGMRFGSP